MRICIYACIDIDIWSINDIGLYRFEISPSTLDSNWLPNLCHTCRVSQSAFKDVSRNQRHDTWKSLLTCCWYLSPNTYPSQRASLTHMCVTTFVWVIACVYFDVCQQMTCIYGIHQKKTISKSTGFPFFCRRAYSGCSVKRVKTYTHIHTQDNVETVCARLRMPFLISTETFLSLLQDCIYVYLYVCIYAYLYLYVRIYVYVFTYIFTYVLTCIYIFGYAFTYLYLRISLRMYLRISISLRVYLHICIYVYLCVYVFTCIYIWRYNI